MAVRRKSNWYIYLLAFLITLAFVLLVIFTFRSFLFPENSEEVGLTSEGNLSEGFTPTSKHSFTLVTMLGDDILLSPSLFMMVIYNAPESSVSFVPIPEAISIHSEGRNLPNVYAAKGGQGVSDVISGVTGLSIDGFVYLDKEGFVDLVTAFGNVQYDVPKTIIVSDGNATSTINSGTQLMSAETVYNYIMKAEFSDEQERFSTIGDIMSELINQNYSFGDSSLLDQWVKIMANGSENNLTDELYATKKAALLNTITYGNAPAEYYLLYGEYEEDGGYTLSQTSVTTLRQKAGIE